MTFSALSKQWNRPIVLWLVMLLILLPLVVIPNASDATTKHLMFNPLRVIFADRQRSTNVHVINTSDEEITYTINLVTKRKGSDGKLYLVEKETEQEQMIKKMIRYSPRRATIAPRSRQVVKLMVRKPKDLEPGEYQTRLGFTPLPPSKSEPPEGQGLVMVNFIITSTIPIIIQHDTPPAEVTPTSISLEDLSDAPSGLGAKLTLNRKGSISAFGDLRLYFIPSDNPKKSREIGRLFSVAIYIPNTERTLTVPLKDITRQELEGGTIRVTFQPSTGLSNKRKQKKAQLYSKDFVLP